MRETRIEEACARAVRMIALWVDGVACPDEHEEARLRAHLQSCASCRSVLDEHRTVAAILRARPAHRISASFGRRLAPRLDDAAGWIGIADWRVWTFRLAPVVAALALMAVFTTRATAPQTLSLDEWTRATVEASPSSSLLWESVNPESLVELMLTGATAREETGSVR